MLIIRVMLTQMLQTTLLQDVVFGGLSLISYQTGFRQASQLLSSCTASTYVRSIYLARS